MASAITPGIDLPTDIRQFVGTYMGKKIKQNARELFTNIRLVDLHVKPSYLLDFGVEGIEKLVSLIEEMKTRRYITNILNILQLGMDVIIMCPTIIKTMQCPSTEWESKFTIVDVSKRRGAPEVMCKCVHVFGQLKQVISTIDPDFEHIRLVIVDCKTANLTTIFGLLLGYPVVYWFENEDGLMANCLDMEPLVNFKVMGQGQKNESEHCVYSFSIPQRVFANLQDKVTEWFKVIYDNSEWTRVFCDLTLTHTTVQLNTVAL
ncbi:UPF0739 protein C1orf74 homolog [Mizuhopecten yessoensis]|nr:UPF0739 protein C1orf74 homolog [Mizuhopecten yessoensis]